jgi:hypothetical protein
MFRAGGLLRHRGIVHLFTPVIQSGTVQLAAAPRPTSPARRLKQLVRDEAVRGTVRTKSTAQLELMLR